MSELMSGDDGGSSSPLASPLRARSQRERKRNPFIFNDDAETYYPSSLGGGSKLSYSPRKAASQQPVTYGRKPRSPAKSSSTPSISGVKVEAFSSSSVELPNEVKPSTSSSMAGFRAESPPESMQLTSTESEMLAAVDASIVDTKPSAGHHQKRISKVAAQNLSFQVVPPARPSASVNLFQELASVASSEQQRINITTSSFAGRHSMMDAVVQQRHQQHPTAEALEASQTDKKVAQRIGIKLRNLLKLPKAHKWVCYEWFYSNIDKPLFDGDNDFVLCLKESFPQLKTTKMTRTEWCKIRRLMGKPRRCSQAFFTEERAALMTKRAKIRMLQQRKVTELTNFKDLPERIPLPLVIGMKVTARLRRPQDGLFTGVVDAVNTIDNTYRVTFDRSGLGTLSVADFEVLSNLPIETMPLSAFAIKSRPKLPPAFPPIHFPSPPKLERRTRLDNDPFLGTTTDAVKKQSLWDSDLYGGFPVKFLKHVVLLTKILKRKKELIARQREMNSEAEVVVASSRPLASDFQRRYAGVVLELESVNRELRSNLTQIQSWVGELAPDQGLQPLNKPVEIWAKCQKDADEMVTATNKKMLEENSSNQLVAFNRMAGNDGLVRSEKSLKLVSKLSALLLHIKMLGENDLHSFEFASLGTSLMDIKKTLDPSNVKLFEDHVEVHVNHIQGGLTQLGNLTAFSAAES